MPGAFGPSPWFPQQHAVPQAPPRSLRPHGNSEDQLAGRGDWPNGRNEANTQRTHTGVYPEPSLWTRGGDGLREAKTLGQGHTAASGQNRSLSRDCLAQKATCLASRPSPPCPRPSSGAPPQTWTLDPAVPHFNSSAGAVQATSTGPRP